jgi:YD repeat-containing protein
VTDANENDTSYTYDDLGRLISITSPDTGSTTYTYDSAGNIVSKKDANVNTVTYTYDALNRLIGIHYTDSSQDITYTYDVGQNGKGRPTSVADPSGTYSFSYDPLGNLIREERTIDGLVLTTQYSYDPTRLSKNQFAIRFS